MKPIILARTIGAMASTLLLAVLFPATGRAQTLVDTSRTDNLPVGRGQLGLETLTLRLTSGNLEVSFVPLDERVLRLLQRDTYQGVEQTLVSEQTAIDSAARASGVTDPGLALVSFHGLAPNTRFDPSLLTLTFHGQQYRPDAWVALSATFSNQQLDVRTQVQAIFIYRRAIPVREPFTLSYLGASTDDWGRRLPRFDLERTRVLGARAASDSGARR